MFRGGGAWKDEILGGRKPYLGLVATRCGINASTAASRVQANSISWHLSQDDIRTITVGFGNFYRGELGLGQSVALTVGIQDAAGNVTQLLSGGSPTLTVANQAIGEISGTLNRPILRGTWFAVRIYAVSSGGTIYSQYGNTSLGDAYEDTATTLANKSLSGTITAHPGYCIRPLYIVGMTRRRSVAIVGDSMVADTNELNDGSETSPDFGIVARWIGPNFAYAKLGVSGETAAAFAAGATLRKTILQYASDVIFELGSNDIFTSSHSAAVTQADMAACWAFATVLGKKAWQTTIPPRPTSSSDSWASNAGQTVTAAKNNVRVAVNAAIRAGLPGVAGYFEQSNPLEDIRDSGKYITNGTANYYTNDGTHGIGETAYALVAEALREIARQRLQ